MPALVAPTMSKSATLPPKYRLSQVSKWLFSLSTSRSAGAWVSSMTMSVSSSTSLQSRGVETATADERIQERLLSLRGGERMLTDLRHLGQSLHAAMSSLQLGVGALVEWLKVRISEANDIGISEVTRRLETDAKAVTILTVHRSKGLEFREPTASSRASSWALRAPVRRPTSPKSRMARCCPSGSKKFPGCGSAW
jgi:hypothetical protein